MTTREIKSKKPWKLIKPDGYMEADHLDVNGNYFDDGGTFMILRQSDFLRQYYPTGHVINDPTIYEDIHKEYMEDVYDIDGEPVLNEDGTIKQVKKYVTEYIPRVAFAFQQLICLKQCIHATGNDIQFESSAINPSAAVSESITEIREGWLDKDMEIAWYEFVKSVKKTGDGAIVTYFDNGELCYKVLSYADGDTLFPHYRNGKLVLFARSFKDYDENGAELTEWLEVYDEKYLYRYKRALGENRGIIDHIKEIFKIDGYSLVEKQPHGFPDIPVTYLRDDDGPCWIFSQDSIENYELSVSQMMHNNQAYGFPIMHIATEDGDDVSINRDISGSVKEITTGKDDKVDYLSSTQASESFLKQLEVLYKMIYEQSFTVSPPELKSGDLPAAALKILYSPAYEKAMDDAAKFQPALNMLVRLFLYGYGVEKGKQLTYESDELKLKWWIKPYVHVNWSTTITDLASAVANGFCSKQTAAERASEYTTVGEWERIMREYKQKQEIDTLNAIHLEREKGKITAKNTATSTEE